jgi:hypothetical protein
MTMAFLSRLALVCNCSPLATIRAFKAAPALSVWVWSAGKNVFVEKPLALSKDELNDILDEMQKGEEAMKRLQDID